MLAEVKSLAGEPVVKGKGRRMDQRASG